MLKNTEKHNLLNATENNFIQFWPTLSQWLTSLSIYCKTLAYVNLKLVIRNTDFCYRITRICRIWFTKRRDQESYLQDLRAQFFLSGSDGHNMLTPTVSQTYKTHFRNDTFHYAINKLFPLIRCFFRREHWNVE